MRSFRVSSSVFAIPQAATGVKEEDVCLSMGMSHDFEQAIEFGATHVSPSPRLSQNHDTKGPPFLA